ncbi:hypothetical protein [Asanoa siamensis]|uniref:Secreted protein n=1 Tax=Asanoa siamensis TaxID=926357 RepID=A0ABQ4D0S5_9ACTN|nr:hypothetical protein [Asanoa siamensis]GIF77147.1 hypothetical protein Asi02nite_66650 [Asanoa siamensis]
MGDVAVIAAVAVFVGLVVLVELASAVLPVVIIITCVPPHERPALVALVEATGGRRLRLGRALRLAVVALGDTHTRDTRPGL